MPHVLIWFGATGAYSRLASSSTSPFGPGSWWVTCMHHASTCPQRQGGGLVFRPPKGRNKRVVPLPPVLLRVLRAHREVQALERMVAGDAWAEHDLVFVRRDGRPIDPRDDYDDWKDLLKAVGIRDARLHDGRRWNAADRDRRPRPDGPGDPRALRHPGHPAVQVSACRRA